jgi:hypothetical protein
MTVANKFDFLIDWQEVRNEEINRELCRRGGWMGVLIDPDIGGIVHC